MQKIYEKLAAIQAELHSPKSEYNSFGKYSYRTAEAILEAVKPFLKAQGCVLNCSDELLLIGDRYYIKATAIIVAVEDGSSVSTTAWAREELDKKWMDQSQKIFRYCFIIHFLHLPSMFYIISCILPIFTSNFKKIKT